MNPLGHALAPLLLAFAALSPPAGRKRPFPTARSASWCLPPGGGADNLARAIVPKAAQILGVPIVIENKPGAGGNIGAAEVARAAPDGYTLLQGTNGTHGINQALYEKTGVRSAEGLHAHCPLHGDPGDAGGTAVPAHNVKELLAYIKANPGKVSFASAGNGTTSHLAGVRFAQLTGADIVHIPYKGGGAALTGVLAGDVQMMIDLMVSVYPNVKAGKLRALAVTTKSRVPTAPDVPTLDESGVPGFDIAASDGVSHRPARRRRSSTSSMPRSGRRSRIRRCATAWSRAAPSRCRARRRILRITSRSNIPCG